MPAESPALSWMQFLIPPLELAASPVARGKLEIDLACGDLPQGQNDFLVVGLVLDQRLGAFVQLLGTLGGHHDQQKAVRDLGEAVFDGYAGHRISCYV